MKKRILSILCVLCLIVGLLPVTAVTAASAPETTTYSYAYDAQRNPSFPASKGAVITLRNFKAPLKLGADVTNANPPKYESASGSWTLTEVGTYSQKNSFSPQPTSYLDGVVRNVADTYDLDDTGKNALMIHKLTDQGGSLVGYGVVVAVDEANGLALFIGDLWNSYGAGYLLSNRALTDSVTLNTDQMAQSSYSISLSPSSVSFADAQTGYAAPAAQTITVTNTGNAATGALSVMLSGTNASSFTLSTSSISDIAKGGSTTFTVQPRADLTAGTHTATITVKGTNVLPETVSVSFKVSTPTTYTVTFVGGEGATGTAPTQAATVKDGRFNLPANPFTKAEHTFAGWNDGSRTYEAGAEYTMPGRAVTFTAQWTPANYSVTLNPQGGTIASGKNITGYTYGVGATLPTAEDITKTGYTFAGWYTSANPGVEDTAVTAITATDTENKIFYAKWTPKTYTVTFNANGGEGSMSAQTFTHGVSQGLTANAFTKTGHTFAGWAASANGDVLYENNESVSITADTELFARWTANPVPTPPARPTYTPSGHVCTSKCEICGKCTDPKCRRAACADKCSLGQNVFKDVKEGTWYADAVKYVSHRGMMDGVGNGFFDIDSATTRAMIVTILWRLEGEPAVNYAMDFEDVSASTWYTEAVRWAASEKIVEGWNGKFDPMGKITREQFAAILWRYAKYKGCDVSVGEDTNILSYEDAFSVSEYAIPAMQWACGAGLMEGDGVNLNPKANATRIQAAALFQRFCQKTLK